MTLQRIASKTFTASPEKPLMDLEAETKTGIFSSLSDQEVSVLNYLAIIVLTWTLSFS